MEAVILVLVLLLVIMSILQLIFTFVLFQYISKRVDYFIDESTDELSVINKKVQAVLENR